MGRLAQLISVFESSGPSIPVPAEWGEEDAGRVVPAMGNAAVHPQGILIPPWDLFSLVRLLFAGCTKDVMV